MSFAYPIWYLLLCGLLGFAFAAALYYKERNVADISSGLRNFFAFIRFAVVSLIAVLLLEPILSYTSTETEKPILLFAADNSSSLSQVSDSTSLSEWTHEWQRIQTELSNDFEVKSFRFGSKLDEEGLRFDAPATNISEALGALYDQYTNRNVGAIVLASDGIYNEGANPAYGGRQLAVPMYTIGLGDTAVRKDLRIDRTYSNRIVYLDDRFAVRVDLSAVRAQGARSTLNLYRIEDGKSTRLDGGQINISDPFYDEVKEFVITADKPGVMHLRFAASEIEGEVTGANNYKDLFVDVLDARQKVLLLAHAPHPDVAAIRQVLENNANYEVAFSLASEFNQSVKEYDLAILHGLPSAPYPVDAVVQTLNENGIPALFVLAKSVNLSRFNAVQSVLKITGSNNASNEVLALPEESFGLFTSSDELLAGLRRFPPLTAPFGQYQATPEARVMLNQRIGSVSTDYPLLAFSESGAQRIGVLTAEGIWRWRLHNWFEKGNHDQFEELLGKSLQYLSVKSDRRTFRTFLSQNVFSENEPVIVQAQLYNSSYEPVNDPDVLLVLTDQEGKQFEFRFDRRGNGYYLDAGSLAPGNYTYQASTTWDKEAQTHTGRFTVSPVQLEAIQLTANHGLLNELATSGGGTFYSGDNMASLLSSIRDNNEIRPVLHESVRSRSVMHIRWICFALLALLGVEWFARKYFGAY